MAVRIRKDRKTIVCAAKSQPQKDDYYIDDTLHHILHSEMRVLHTDEQDNHGADLWYFNTTFINMGK